MIMANIDDLIGKVTDFLRSEVKTETIIGQQFQLGEFTCVPVISIGLGFGGGTGVHKGMHANKNPDEEDGTGTGGAAGIGMSPVGFLATKGNDIQFIPASSSKGLSGAF